MIAYLNFPEELRNVSQWIVWKYGPPRTEGGKPPKVPYNPKTHEKASSTNPNTWATFREALGTYQSSERGHNTEAYKGIGFMFLAGQGYVGVDLDECFDLYTKSANEWARGIIERLNSYTEASPSYTGVHIIVKGTIPRGRHNDVMEIYQEGRFFTVTGLAPVLNGMRPIAECQDELMRIYHEVFGEEERPPSTRPPRPTLESTLDDAELIEKMHAPYAKHGEKFKALWAGDWKALSIGDGSQSAADMALCGILAFYTGGNADQMDRFFRQSGLYRKKWDEKRGDITYGGQTILRAINGASLFYTPGSGKRREYRSVTYTQPYQRTNEQPEERARMLQERAEEVREWTARAIERRDLVTGIASPPGVGKSFTVAAWGVDKDIAYIIPRHAQETSIPVLKQEYRIVVPPTAETCENYQLHETLARAGYNTIFAHQHGSPTCLYRQQFERKGSAVYQTAHATTTYPAMHAAIVVDEFSITEWYNTRQLTHAEMKQAKSTFEKHTPAYQLLNAFQVVLGDIEAGDMLQGKALLDRLNDHLQGRLEAVIEALSSDYKATDRYPLWTKEHTDRVVLPHLWNTLNDEAAYWKHGGDWNSYMRVVGYKEKEMLYLTEPRRFQARTESELPPLVILDATMHEDLLARWAGHAVTTHRPTISPPPHTRHIGARVARYGKTNLTYNKEHRDRAINQAEHVLDTLGIVRETVGLITFKDVADQIGEALDIPVEQRLHFFASRGSNAIEHCETLLIIGTPTLSPDQMYRYARAIYHDDRVPIVEGSDQTEAGIYRYKDGRVQRLAEYITRAELTQCAHRNRPLRYDGRTVITFCQGEIDFLPLTEEPITFPTLTERKADQERQAVDAIERIMARDGKLTVRALLAECPMGNDRAQEYVRRYK